MKLRSPDGKVVVETTTDLSGPYLRQGWTESATPKTIRHQADRASTKSGEAASTTTKEKHDGD